MDRPFAAFHSRGTKLPCWNAKVVLGQDQQKAHIILNGNFLCLSCPSATFASQHGGFVPREWTKLHISNNRKNDREELKSRKRD